MSKDQNKKPVPHNRPAGRPSSGEERLKILETALFRMVMIDGMVYGLEDDTEPEVFVDCAAEIASCRANCCTRVFALTREEVKKGFFKYSAERPYYMARNADGYCHYLDRKTFSCSIHEKRPLRCRKYACSR
jgi:Putative zinc- or iron-chelating domain